MQTRRRPPFSTGFAFSRGLAVTQPHRNLDLEARGFRLFGARRFDDVGHTVQSRSNFREQKRQARLYVGITYHRYPIKWLNRLGRTDSNL
uniref:Uncharacterized protein n=1 Tax=Rhizobium rhizogenes TaxID=359 RepID=A0A7S4ZV18_RHIRH|nr:hypothetical protein [Rhizobium rhizogenes]QCL10549.1 hypothetical protein pC6.5d_656 [Rhizobium rhizogenes]